MFGQVLYNEKLQLELILINIMFSISTQPQNNSDIKTSLQCKNNCSKTESTHLVLFRHILQY
jgi:hypothetical protein